MPLAPIPDAIAAIARGEIVIVVDDEDRENEGDLIMAAEFATPEAIAFFLHHTSGVICVSITPERAAELDLGPMVLRNTETQRTAFLVSVDLRGETTTGISAPTPRSVAATSGSRRQSHHTCITMPSARITGRNVSNTSSPTPRT